MSWRDRGRVADHFSATGYAGGEADQGHKVRHAAGRRHRLQIQRLQAGRVTPCTQTSRSAEGTARSATRPNRAAYQAVDLAGGLACMAVRPTRSHFPRCEVGSRYGNHGPPPLRLTFETG